MLRCVLVAVDDDPCSRLAARHTFKLARAIGGTVTLLHVHRSDRAEAGHSLMHELSRYARRPPACLMMPTTAAVAPIILDTAMAIGAELIVIGLQGGTKQMGRTLGPVTFQVLLNSPVPVQVVGPGIDLDVSGGWGAVFPRN
ncbi:universal stress protein [Deinococcus oregonensis]|uniref:Universal stress protein n=1 Tax=Deinococcus oregonensis TaxID=1805970 RepID=A0ABV6AUF4_9DEIO